MVNTFSFVLFLFLLNTIHIIVRETLKWHIFHSWRLSPLSCNSGKIPVDLPPNQKTIRGEKANTNRCFPRMSRNDKSCSVTPISNIGKLNLLISLLRRWFEFYKSKFPSINKWILLGATPNRRTGRQNNRVINPKTSNANLQIQNDVLASSKNKRRKIITPLHYSMELFQGCERPLSKVGGMVKCVPTLEICWCWMEFHKFTNDWLDLGI